MGSNGQRGSVRDPRPRIEHCGYPTPAGIERMHRLGVTAVNQPSYLFDFGDECAASLGDHVHDLQPGRDELDAACGSSSVAIPTCPATDR
jgi:predicted amidohydrolase YtcJ